MKKVKFLSALMAFCMIFGAIAELSILPVFAADSETTSGGETETIDYTVQVYASEEEKLATMDFKLEKYGYKLYCQPYTGEVALLDTATGNILFTNPYDVGSATASKNIKNQLLSQIIIGYNDNTSDITMYSYVEAACRNQIRIKNVKNGIRVEYIMGRQETRKLVPRMIEKSRYQTQILDYITSESKYKKLDAFYTLKDPKDPTLTERGVKEMQAKYPITEKMAVYIFDEYAAEREINQIESIIKEFCPHYTYAELESDHLMTNYTGNDADPVLFRLSLEYYLEEEGMSVRLPANGIRFDESNYTLNFIQILPYIGAGSSEFTGYTVIPDGSGTLIRFEDVLATGSSRTIAGKLYGQDYAYHTISGAHQQVMRLPIFGLVENAVYTKEVAGGDTTGTDTADTTEAVTTAAAETQESAETDETEAADTSTADTGKETPVEEYTVSKGYVAIIEEGDALASIITDHGGNTIHKYNSVYTKFNPRPNDEYNLAESISVGENTTWTVVSERKYTGSYRIKYIMLTDESVIEEKNLKDAEYPATYTGMALAYRNYLINKGVISTLEQTDTQIPLYLETLGVMDVDKKILSIPVKVKTALTSFEDLKTITNELGEKGISNIIYKLTGYANGGMNKSTVPYKIDIEKSAGNDDGLKDFLKFTSEKDIDVYLNLELSYATNNKAFDGFSYRKDAVKTIDNRYIQKRTYSATLQYFTRTGQVAISPSVFEKIFNSMKDDLSNLGITGVALSTLGTDLNSDFDEDEPYNREDSKEFVVNTLSKVKEAYYNIMLDGGNAYTLKYASHVLNVALDSSKYTYASESIPLFGLVFHGYLNFAGTPTNMAGDMRYEFLKMIENGSYPYFILAYQNTEKLKEDYILSKYYSISYSIWKEDLVNVYNELNGLMSDVMYATLTNHEFLKGERIPSEKEIAADEAERIAAESEAAEKAAESAAESERIAKLKERKDAESAVTGEVTTEIVEETTAETVAETAAETGDATPGNEDEEQKTYVYGEKYVSDNGRIVRITYSNGIQFILNYNNFAVTVEGLDIDSLSYIKIEP